MSEVDGRWRRLAEHAASALLQAEAHNISRLRTTLRAANARLVARLISPGPDRRRAAELAMRLVSTEAATLRTVAGQVTRSMRMDAKQASIRRLAVEWEAVRRQLRGGDDIQAIGVAPVVTTPTDDAAATAAGESLSAAWTTAMLSAVWDWQSGRAETMGQAITRAAAPLDKNVRRLAATETARAFADARDDEMAGVRTQYKERSWFPLLLKQWDATNDRKLCAACAALDGTLRPWGIPFPGKAEPGYVHPFCRCVAVTVLLPMPRTRAREQVGLSTP